MEGDQRLPLFICELLGTSTLLLVNLRRKYQLAADKIEDVNVYLYAFLLYHDQASIYALYLVNELFLGYGSRLWLQ